MKRILIATCLIATSVAVAAPAMAAPAKVTVCHKAGGKYKALTVSASALPAHLAHGDVYPVPAAGCASLNPGPTPTPTPTPTPVPAPVVEAIPDWLLQFGRAESDGCPTGWGKSWSEWPNGHTGGFVCTRTIPVYGEPND